jgi:4-alpha-glucanotransferase
MEKRGSGILLHMTSLPSAFGIGDLGPWAYRFADFLQESRQRYWQCLPLNPTDTEAGNSPYHSTSAFACNPLLISPELLVQEGLLGKEDLEVRPNFPTEKVDYSAVTLWKDQLFSRAFELFRTSGIPEDYHDFCEQNRSWLDPFALFTALRVHHGLKAWCDWPEKHRDVGLRTPGALSDLISTGMEKVKFLQYIFFKQWWNLKSYCNNREILIIGDIPIYVIHDSTDVWMHPEIFNLDPVTRKPLTVAGVPPDYFSNTGQFWGNPVYRWDVMKSYHYRWWMKRMAHNLRLFDLVRIDHFRGFIAYWEIPASETVAVHGQWVKAPAMDFFSELTQRFPDLPVIAEDLGTITPEVWEVMDHFGFPGMKVLLFAFGPDLPENLYAPHNHTQRSVVYTGTHDNNTVRGWFDGEASPEDKRRLALYLGKEVTADNAHWELIRLAMMSVAQTAVIPIQDVLGLGREARMNTPARDQGNWTWRIDPNALTSSVSRALREMTELYGRGLP